MMWNHWKEEMFYLVFPPNVTSTRQPADMGTIICLKVEWKTIMLSKLIDVFDAEGGYELASERISKKQNCCKGLVFGGKIKILDMM